MTELNHMTFFPLLPFSPSCSGSGNGIIIDARQTLKDVISTQIALYAGNVLLTAELLTPGIQHNCVYSLQLNINKSEGEHHYSTDSEQNRLIAKKVTTQNRLQRLLQMARAFGTSDTYVLPF